MQPSADLIDIYLPASKSISNRLLILQALSKGLIDIEHLSDARDTVILQALLAKGHGRLQVHDAGTAMRFATAYFAIAGQQCELHGTDRMHQRPIHPLVEVLRHLGADISYLAREGYPPLQLNGFHGQQCTHISIDSSVSSQFISAVMMVATALHDGLSIHISAHPISRPYIEMTMQLMQQCGVPVRWENEVIHVPHHSWQPCSFEVESDWSAASYFYAALVLMRHPKPTLLHGLRPNSLQGDAIVAQWFESFGVRTTFVAEGALIERIADHIPAHFDASFSATPDLAQTMAVVLGALGIPAVLHDVQSLRIKETDRIAALKAQLQKFGVKITTKGNSLIVDTENHEPPIESIMVQTYDDHRMAMSFAPLMLHHKVIFDTPEVVRKSFPSFWQEWEKVLSADTPPNV